MYAKFAIRLWGNLATRLLWEQEIAGSNPAGRIIS
jgi:hypothetical protein